MVRLRAHDSPLRGTLIGAAIGAVGGALLATINENQDAAGFASAALLGGGFGAGIGAIVDALIPGKKVVIYRAPGASGSARLSIAPAVTPRTKGVAVSVSF